MSKTLLRSKNIRPVISPLSMFSSTVFVRCVRHVHVEGSGKSRIGEEEEACVPVNSCSPQSGQPVQVFWRKL